jgi:hypothetical protein
LRRAGAFKERERERETLNKSHVQEPCLFWDCLFLGM